MQDMTEKLVRRLQVELEKNSVIEQILTTVPLLGLPKWYLGAGCVAQTVWNSLHGYDPTRSIEDYDLAYFDSADLSEDAESRYIQAARLILGDLGITLDIKNQARVHLWYKNHFGLAIRPYYSIEDAICSWPTTATSIGVRYEENGTFTVFAPFGLSDLFLMIIRPNKKQLEYFLTRNQSTSITVYNEKVQNWTSAWPKLVVIPWES